VALPTVSGRDVVKLLTRIGFNIVGRKGSHIRLKKKNNRTLVAIVPDHKEIAKGTLKLILKQAGLTREEFLDLLR
jgi:predicted RNA binding protein YcfA (HicA-like mRNA interferase family)